MSIYSRNALYAVRLVLENQRSASQQVAFSTLGYWKEQVAPLSFSDSTSASANSNVSVKFLEDENDEEYEKASKNLVTRPVAHHDLPWPTLFPPKNPQYGDLLFNFVQKKQYTLATTILKEIKDNEASGNSTWTIREREIYIEPAVHCLHSTPMDKEGFFLWMSLYPRRAVSNTTPELGRTFHPIVDHIRYYHIHDQEFLKESLLAFAKMGLLATVARRYISHMTLTLPPAESLSLMRDMVEEYNSACINGFKGSKGSELTGELAE